MIRAKHVDNRDEAEMIFSTVHRSKGMEYDVVQIVNDFLSEEHLIKLKEKNRTGVINQTELNEEINLLYVAVTRTRNSVYIPETLIPKSFPASSRIRIMKGFNKKEYVKDLNSSINITVGDKLEKGLPKIQKTKTFDEIRLKYEHAYKPWSPFLDAELTVMFNEGVTQKDMAKHFGRTRGAVRSRVKKLGLKTN